jgi:hypothetical protein
MPSGYADKTYTKFCVVVNNPTYADNERLRCYLDNRWLYTHLVVGYENWFPSFNGVRKTPHQQITFYTSNPRSWRSVKDDFPRGYVKPCEKAYIHSVRYCKKDGIFNQRGSLALANVLDGVDLRLWLSKVVQSTLGGKGGSITPPSHSDDDYWKNLTPAHVACYNKPMLDLLNQQYGTTYQFTNERFKNVEAIEI